MINGFIVIDKPAGITSHDVVSRVRRLLGTRKVGHTGTLDPFATGVLPVAVNDGTKAIPFLDEGLKCYEALIQLGVSTDTLDMTGSVISNRDFSQIARESFIDVCRQFTGTISQIPPMYSAIKQGGQPLYKLARQGVEVVRDARSVEIFSLDIIDFSLPFVSVRVKCSRGTYVRTLADDIGRELGCGAALKELRRTSSGLFDIQSSLTLSQLEEVAGSGNIAAFSQTPFDALAYLPDLQLAEAGVTKISFGRIPDVDDIIHYGNKPDYCGLVRLSFSNQLVAIADMVNCGSEKPEMKLKRVFLVS